MRSLSQVELELLAKTLGSYDAYSAYQMGKYVNAALTTTWVDLVSTNFINLGTDTDPVTGPEPCQPNLHFTELQIFNDSANILYVVFRPAWNDGGGPPTWEDPAVTAQPIPANTMAVIPCARCDMGNTVGTISIIGSAAATACRLIARFSNQA